jgi:hypothetical protein
MASAGYPALASRIAVRTAVRRAGDIAGFFNRRSEIFGLVRQYY